jgi:hypothetical protein
MKKTKTVETIVCDVCETRGAYKTCLGGCGKYICWECKSEGRAKEYAHAVYFSGSGDGTYCLECDKRLTAEGQPLHAAYRVVGHLRDEMKRWGDDFKIRADKAEANLKRLRADNGT